MNPLEHLSNQMDGAKQHWTEKWLSNISKADSEMDLDDPRMGEPGRSRDSSIFAWVNSSIWAPAEFPTHELQRRDSHWGERGHEKHWDPNPEVRKSQKPLSQRPQIEGSSNTLSRMSIDTSRPDHIHEMMKGTGAPEQINVFRRGDIPKNARYASGSVDPSWPDVTRDGGSNKDISVNKGRLHIYLVPHEDILEAGSGSEGEVFFRRGTPFNKTKRTTREQKRVESRMEDIIEHDY